MRRVLLFVVVLLAGTLLAAAQNSGYDVFQTGSGAAVDLTSMGLGQVALQGVPIMSSTGNSDTIMYRPQAVPAGGGTIPVNVWAVFMKSVNPVNLNGTSADVYITVNATGGAVSTSVLPQPDALTPSTGTITVYPNADGTGGTFDSSITVNADIIFVTAGTSVTNSANYLATQPAPAITLSQTGSTYSTTAPPGYPIQATAPPQAGAPGGAAAAVTITSGGFFPKPVHVGPHPVVPGKVVVVKCLTPFVPTSDAKVSSGSTNGTKSAPTQGTPNDILVCYI